MLNKKEKIYLSIIWSIFFVPILLIILILFLVSIETFGPMPKIQELQNPKSKLASEIFSSDQQLLGKYYLEENRTMANYDDISMNLVNALIATEDIRFYEHSGIDIKGLARVLFRTILMRQEQSGGGSTITQQLAKNLFPRDTIQNESSLKKSFKIGIAKLKEWVTAVRLEKYYTKDEIIVLYLNTVPFGSNAYGIKSASRIFFNKDPQQLSIDEASVLVGMLKAPTGYNPKSRPERAKKRRNVVLSQIQENQKTLNKLTGFKILSKKQFDSLRALPIRLAFKQQAHNEGLATYFREYLRKALTATKPKRESYNDFRAYEEDSIQWETNPMYGWCNKNKKPDGTYYDLYRDGLRIYTTINSRMQRYAEEAVEEHLGTGKKPLQKDFENDLKRLTSNPFTWELTPQQIKDIMWNSVRRSERYRILKQTGMDSSEVMKNFKTKTEMSVFSWRGEIDTIMTPWDSILYYKRFLRAGFISMDPQTGYVKAYVGGTNFNHFKYDHVMLSKRQVGSTFKPFLYTVGIMLGIKPCRMVPNIPVSFEMPSGQKPPIYTPKFSETPKKIKRISIKGGLANSLNQIAAWVMKQIERPEKVVEFAHQLGIKSYMEPVYSLCVGSAEVRLAEMVAAYGTYANKGTFVEPIFVTRIVDKNGNVITAFKPKKTEVINESVCYTILNMMQAVVNEGTSSSLRLPPYNFKNEMAGKTGTTNNAADGWFIGFVPNLVSGGWVGGEERSIRFSSGMLGYGAGAALPIWAIYMQKCYADPTLNVSKANFEKPDNAKSINLDCGGAEYDDDNSNTGVEEEKY